MPIIPDLRYSGDLIAGAVNPRLMAQDTQDESSSALDTLSAVSRLTMLPGAAYARATNRDPDLPDAPQGWDPLDNIQGYEDYAQDFVDVQTPGELAGRKARIDDMRSDREVLGRAGLGGPVAEIAMGLLDPSFLAAIAVPELAVAKGVWLGRALNAAIKGAAVGATYESGLQLLQETRPGTDALYTVGGGALLGGVLGSLGRSVPKSELKPVQAAIQNELQRSEAGAAAVARPTTLEAESLARGGQMLSKGISKVPLMATDLDRVMQSESIVAKQTLQDLADVPGVLGKNVEGIATPTSVESLTQKWDASLADLSDQLKTLWVEHRKTGSKLSQSDFYASIAASARRGDKSPIAEVAKGAAFLRGRIFDPLKEDAQKLGLLKDPVEQAQLRAEEHAVGEYFKAQEKQLFSDYLGRTRAAVREGTGLAGDAAAAGTKAGQVRDELERAVTTEEGIKNLTLSDSAQRAQQAQDVFDSATTEARSNLQRTFDAARQDAEVIAQQVGAQNANRADQFALGVDIEKHVREISIAKADDLVEQVMRDHQALSRKARAELPRDKARIEILKSKLRIEGVRREAAKAILDARRTYDQGAKKLKEQFGAEDVPTGSDHVTGRAVREFRRLQRQVRRDLELARKAEGRVSAQERKRFSLAVRSLKKEALEQLDDIDISNLKDFRKRADKVTLGEADADPAVTELAKLMQDRKHGKLASRVTVPKIDPARVKQVAGAESYFRRMYDREAIRAGRQEWDRVVISHFMKGDATHAEAVAAAEDVTRKILGGDIGQANWSAQVTVGAAGPLKDRVLNIEDALIEPFLVNDPMRVASAYVKDLAPQVELTKRFGDREMKEALGKVTEEYDLLREKARQTGDSDTITRLEKQEKDALEALVRVRDRVLGRAGRLGADASEGTRRAVAASRGWRNLVASARLGGTALTGGQMDTVRIIAQYGFLPTMRKLTQLARSSDFRALSKAQARRVGSAVEAALSRRVNVAYDGAITEGWTQKLANGLYRWTGLNHITDFNRTLGASLLEDKVLKVAAQVAEGGRPKKWDLTRLASLGLDEDALRGIHSEVKSHGGETDGIRVSGSADWTNKRLSDVYDAAILRESKIIVQQPGAADRVWWMDSETGKLIGQLKSFSLSAPMRMLIAPVQLAGQGQYMQAARFAGFMMIGGYLTHSLRQALAGKLPTTDPKTAAFEAFTESGMGGVVPDVLSPLGRKFGVLGNSVRYSDRNVVSAYGGPGLGAFYDAYDMAFNRTENGLTARDLHALRRLLPWNQAWMFRRGINALEGELAEGFGLEGADTASFADRLMRTEALPNATQSPQVAAIRP